VCSIIGNLRIKSENLGFAPQHQRAQVRR
jgi:hypothetical protein